MSLLRWMFASLISVGLTAVTGFSLCADEQNGAAKAGAPGEAPAASSFPAASPELVENVKGLLDEGFQTGPRKLQGAQKKLAAARNLSADDPRLDFAYGLVLLKHNQNKQAITQFEAAIGRSGAPYWPAWQALVWSQLAEKQYEKGLSRLDEFAALVRKPGDSGELTDAQRDAARWMGQVLEALDKTVNVKKLHELVDQHDRRLLEVLGEDLYSTVQLGRDLVEERDGELSKLADASNAAAEKTRARRQQDQAGKLDSNLRDLDKEKASNAKSAEDWKEWLDKTLPDVDKELEKLEKEYRELEARSETLRQTFSQVGRELTTLDLQMNLIGSVGTSGSAAAQTQMRIMQRQQQMVNTQTEYNVTIGRMSDVAQLGRNANQRRAAIVAKYEKATGQLVKKNAEIDKWSARAAEKKKKLDSGAAGKTKGTKPAARKVASLKSYIPLELDDEKDRVLATFGVLPEPIAVDKPEDAKK